MGPPRSPSGDIARARNSPSFAPRADAGRRIAAAYLDRTGADLSRAERWPVSHSSKAQPTPPDLNRTILARSMGIAFPLYAGERKQFAGTPLWWPAMRYLES